MEKTASAKATKKPSSIAPQDRIATAYVEHLLEYGKRPPSVFKFMKELGMQEVEFYSHFGSFDGLERGIWKGFFDDTIGRLQSDDSYTTFSIREKILAFYYTLFEDLVPKRSFILLQLENHGRLEFTPDFLKDFKAAYETWISSLLAEGKGMGEIANRPYLDKTYPAMYWLQMRFLLLFWRNDNSSGFEQTDAAIEKSVNLSFDLIAAGAVDTAFDFAKFMVQSRTKR